ncbi:unnamed protein product [Cunninghamella echinulata]
MTSSSSENNKAQRPPIPLVNNVNNNISSSSNYKPNQEKITLTDEKTMSTSTDDDLRRTHYLNVIKKNTPGCWTLTTWILTWWAPPFMLKTFGLHEKSMQQAWREKVALVQIIVLLCGIVGFLTFGFNAVICSNQPNRIRPNSVQNDQVIISGRAYNLKSFKHPTPNPNIPGNGNLHELGIGGKDLSFLFQTVNYNCKDVLKPLKADDAKGNVLNYFPCVPIDFTKPSVNGTGDFDHKACHISAKSRLALRNLEVVGDVYFNWTDIQKPGTSLVAFSGNVLDVSRLRLLSSNIPLPLRIAQIFGPGSAFIGRDATYWFSSTSERLKIGKCLTNVLKVGVLDSNQLDVLFQILYYGYHLLLF